jgi:hypothetical protein
MHTAYDNTLRLQKKCNVNIYSFLDLNIIFNKLSIKESITYVFIIILWRYIGLLIII